MRGIPAYRALVVVRLLVAAEQRPQNDEVSQPVVTADAALKRERWRRREKSLVKQASLSWPTRSRDGIE